MKKRIVKILGIFVLLVIIIQIVCLADEVIYEESSTFSGTGKFVFVLLLFILSLCSSIYLLINNLSLNDKLKKYVYLNEEINKKEDDMQL